MIKCAIIGFGKMGRIRADAIAQSGQGELVAVFDPVPIDTPPCAAVENEDAIIDDPTIDAVFICTPNYRIVPLTKTILRAGKHVFSEIYDNWCNNCPSSFFLYSFSSMFNKGQECLGYFQVLFALNNMTR